MQGPRWAEKRRARESEGKAARLAALALMGDRLSHVPKAHVAEALGVSRWTLDRDLVALADVQRHTARLIELCEIEEREHGR